MTCVGLRFHPGRRRARHRAPRGAGRFLHRHRPCRRPARRPLAHRYRHQLPGRGRRRARLQLRRPPRKTDRGQPWTPTVCSRERPRRSCAAPSTFMHGAKGARATSARPLLANKGVDNKTVPMILCDEDDVAGNHGATIGHCVPSSCSRRLPRTSAAGRGSLSLSQAGRRRHHRPG